MSKRGMSTVAIVVSAILALVGLTVLGFFIFLAIALNSFGSSK